MITASEAYELAEKANDTINKERFEALRDYIECNITSEAESGNRNTCFIRNEFNVNGVIGIEFVIDELRSNGFRVDVHRDNYGRFNRMYVSW